MRKETIINVAPPFSQTANADFFESISDGFISINSDWCITYINAKGETVSRRRREDIVGKPFFDVFPEAKGTPFEACYTKVMQTRQADIIEGFYGPQDGWVEVNIYPGGDGGLTFFYRDITSRKRMEILIESQREAMESALSGNPLKTTLEILIRAIESQSGHSALASILLLDDDERHLVHGSAPSLPIAYCQAIDGVEIGENIGSCGTSAYTKKLVIVEDIASDPRWANFKDLALKYNLRACWSLPILSQNNKVLGTFAVYYSQSRIPGTTDQEVIEILSRTAAILIERDKENRRCYVQEDALRKGDERLLQQQRIYETVLSNTPDFAYIIDPQGRFTYANDALLKMWGVENAVGKGFLELGYEPWHAEMHQREINEVIQTKSPIRAEVPFTGTQGKRIYDYIFNPVVSNDGKVIAIAGTTRDITERKAIENELKKSAEALKESESKWRMLTDAMPQLVWVDNADGFCNFLSPQWEDYTGKPLDQLLGFQWFDLLHPEDRQRTEEAWKEAVADRADYNIEYRLRRYDGEYRWFKTRGVPLRDESGKIKMWCGTCTDIQEQMNARQMAEAANQAKTEFLANMSHEIRTPMNAVIGLAHILDRSQPLTVKQQECIKTLKLSADSLLTLINDLLDISKIEARTVELENIPFSLTQLTHEVISILSVRASEKGLTLTSDAEYVKHRMFMGDPSRLRQIIMNLCSNAIKFTEYGGIHISVTCAPSPELGIETVRIAVKDTGMGISSDKLEDIFQKFVQADNSINRKYGGTGLGLAITKTLTEIMGGNVKVESTLGEGSTFTICLPLRIAEHMPQEITSVEGKKILRPEEFSELPRVLLVEDYAANILVATTFLEQSGYSYDLAKNGIEAVEKAKTGDYVAILMDVQMHGMNGFEATHLIRNYEKLYNKRSSFIIGMTAHALAGDRDRCLAVGMDDYIAKPFDHTVLQAKLASAAYHPMIFSDSNQSFITY